LRRSPPHPRSTLAFHLMAERVARSLLRRAVHPGTCLMSLPILWSRRATSVLRMAFLSAGELPTLIGGQLGRGRPNCTPRAFATGSNHRCTSLASAHARTRQDRPTPRQHQPAVRLVGLSPPPSILEGFEAGTLLAATLRDVEQGPRRAREAVDPGDHDTSPASRRRITWPASGRSVFAPDASTR